MIRYYSPSDESALFSLWNTDGLRSGYAPLDADKFHRLLTRHPEFRSEFTFVLEEDGNILGFINGCAGDHIANGAPTGYISCLILAQEADMEENTIALVQALEDAFRKAGRTHSTVSYFNPIRLPWIIPGTNGHQHNNAPGVPVELPLYSRMLALSYTDVVRQCAMHLELAAYETPAAIEEKAAKMAQEGYTVARYNPEIHTGIDEMVAALNNSMWSAEIPEAARTGMDLLVGLYGNTVAGFTGPVYPEETGRGYFAGIGVAPQYERHGLGKLLFYRLLQREKEVGSRYMSLFTGENNPARFIYLEAGFQIVRKFAVMRKEL